MLRDDVSQSIAGKSNNQIRTKKSMASEFMMQKDKSDIEQSQMSPQKEKEKSRSPFKKKESRNSNNLSANKSKVSKDDH